MVEPHSYTTLIGNSKVGPFKYGQMFIALKRNKLSYMPGEIVEGSIFVQQQEPYKSVELRLTFYGKEKSKFSAPEALKT